MEKEEESMAMPCLVGVTLQKTLTYAPVMHSGTSNECILDKHVKFVLRKKIMAYVLVSFNAGKGTLIEEYVHPSLVQYS